MKDGRLQNRKVLKEALAPLCWFHQCRKSGNFDSAHQSPRQVNGVYSLLIWAVRLLIPHQMPKATSREDYLLLFTTVSLILFQRQVIFIFFYLFFNLTFYKVAVERLL